MHKKGSWFKKERKKERKKKRKKEKKNMIIKNKKMNIEARKLTE